MKLATVSITRALRENGSVPEVMERKVQGEQGFK